MSKLKLLVIGITFTNLTDLIMAVNSLGDSPGLIVCIAIGDIDNAAKMHGLLEACGSMPVVTVVQPVKLKVNCIYIVDPGLVLSIKNQSAYPIKVTRPFNAEKPLHILFTTAAESFKFNLLAVLISDDVEARIPTLLSVRDFGAAVICCGTALPLPRKMEKLSWLIDLFVTPSELRETVFRFVRGF